VEKGKSTYFALYNRGMKRVAILGATGSIGKQALEVLERFPEELELVGVSASRSFGELARIVERFRPRAVALLDEGGREALCPSLPQGAELYLGEEGLVALATREDVDLVLVAVVGIAGLLPTLEALKAGKTVALATKEALVAGGQLIQEALRSGRQGAQEDLHFGGGREQEPHSSAPRLIPVDSEHSAIFQCLEGKRREEVKRIILTASGGPFLRRSPAELEKVTPQEALAHPVWKMGPKISVDSATLMNKALEVIEAHFLFGFPPEQISILIHPQGIVHGLVEFQDGSLQALLSLPDMRLPIQYALLYPRRLPSLTPPLDLAEMEKLEFEKADPERFPAIKMAYDVLRLGGTYPAVFSAADEVAVEAFLQGRIPFTRIIGIVEEVIARHTPLSGRSLEEVLEADRWARAEAKKMGTVPIF